jgi:hypothetical protein
VVTAWSQERGHPWRTAEFYELRAYQRSVLRDVLDWIIDRTALPAPTVSRPQPDEASLLELELRRLARAPIQKSELLSAMTGSAAAEALHDFLGTGSPHEHQNGVSDLRMAAISAAEVSMRETYIQDFPEERGGPGDRARWPLTLLVWAEWLADDEYRDPRLPDWVYDRPDR